MDKIISLISFLDLEIKNDAIDVNDRYCDGSGHTLSEFDIIDANGDVRKVYMYRNPNGEYSIFNRYLYKYTTNETYGFT